MGKGSGILPSIATGKNNNNSNVKVAQGDNSDESRTLCTLSLGVVTFFAIHNYLQEAIMQRPNFVYGWSLGLLEMYGTCFFSFMERAWKKKKHNGASSATSSTATTATTSGGLMEAAVSAQGPTSILQKIMYHLLGKRIVSNKVCMDYIIVSFCLASSSSLSSIALNYINFPTKVVFRSSKLLPTMAIAIFVHSKRFTKSEWYSAALVCAGLAMVGLADAQNFGAAFHPLGLILVSTSVMADAITPNIQQRLFVSGGESRPDVIYTTNFIASFFMTIALIYSGDFQGTIDIVLEDTTAAVYMLVYSCVAYIAVSFHMTVVQKFGGVVGVLVGNGRKVLTIVLSFILFPKPVSIMYVVGVACSLGGLTASMLLREQQKKKGNGGGRIERKDSDLEAEMKSLILDSNNNDGDADDDDEILRRAKKNGNNEKETWFEGK
mmetsp:Transcript_1235/g.2008  ORF Transcript_1235/g.2008 Transcript_1235/m.2008 type:complete len:436 (-) Transcript_1235:182-1489(-)